MADVSEFVIEGHTYEVDERNGSVLIAERYEDGTLLGIYVTSEGPASAVFYAYGPRGGWRARYVPGNGTIEEIDEWTLRMSDARRHVAAVERWRAPYFEALRV